MQEYTVKGIYAYAARGGRSRTTMSLALVHVSLAHRIAAES
jgi:hypothetical protein